MDRLVILAGGVSSRMKKTIPSEILLDENLINDAEQKSKSMIRVGEGETPFMNYLLKNAESAGYNEVVIVVNEKDNSIVDYYSSRENLSDFAEIKISFAFQPIPQGREKPMGTADALYHALLTKPEWKGKKFTMCNSDNLYSVAALKLLLQSDHANSMIDYDRNGLEFEKERIEKFAVTKKDAENFLIDIIEKPTAEEIEHIRTKDGYVGVSMNIFRFNYDMIYPLLEITPVHNIRHEKEIPSTVRMMIDKYPRSIYTYRLSEPVPDLSSKIDILKVKEFLQNQFNISN